MINSGKEKGLLREVVLDVETTGLEYDGGDRIIEIGAVELVDWFLGEKFERLVNPQGVEVSETIINLTGLTKEKLAGKPAFDDSTVVDELLDFIGESRIIAHKASFHRGFLNAELIRANREIIPAERWIDSLELARKQFPAGRNSLDKLCERFKISLVDRPKAHTGRKGRSALVDSRLLAKVYLGLNDRLSPELNIDEEKKVRNRMISSAKEKGLLREVVLDVETTGFEYDGGDRIIEIGAVELVDWFLGEEFNRLVNPQGVEVSETIINLTGLTKEKLSGESAFEDSTVVDELLDFIGESKIIAHNASFDRGFLNAELIRANREIIPAERWIDSMELARKQFPAGRNSLDKLCERFKISTVDRTNAHTGRKGHSALVDSRLLAKVYLGLNDRLSPELNIDEEKKVQEIVQERPVNSRPNPLESLLTEAERAAHKEFLRTTFNGDSNWRHYIEV